ncbi:hypothetical protein C4578_02180 [Candidatus Microgenomates bacterium]|jgi:hypothetical protein|nr:MAG: hypothetical protein C4578_02180 [Candidatus Microgenomates bacterium]
MGLKENNTLHANENNTPPVDQVDNVDLTKITFVSLVRTLLKVSVSEELRKLNAYTISDGKGGRILL